MAPTTQPIVFQSVAPVLAAPDVAAAIAFYRDHLGFTVGHTADDPPVYATMHRDGVALHLSRGERLGSAYLTVTGVDDLYDHLRAVRVTIVRPIETAPYGMRDFVFRDVSGNEIQVGQPVQADQQD